MQQRVDTERLRNLHNYIMRARAVSKAAHARVMKRISREDIIKLRRMYEDV